MDPPSSPSSPLPTTTQRDGLHARLARVRAEAERLRLLTDGDVAVRLDAEAARLARTLSGSTRPARAGPRPRRCPRASRRRRRRMRRMRRRRIRARRRRRRLAAALRRRSLDPDPPTAPTALRLERARAWALLQEAAAGLGRVEAAFGLRDAAPCPGRDPPGPAKPGVKGEWLGGQAMPPCRNTAARLPRLPSLAGAWAATRERARRQAAEQRALASARARAGAGPTRR